MTRLSARYKTALVTGGTSGLGLAFTRMLVAEGVAVTILSRRASPELPTTCTHCELDLADGAAVEVALAAGKVVPESYDILINNAGCGVFAPLEIFPAEAIGKQLCLMLETPIRLTHAALPGMLARQRGAIVNVASLAARFPLPYESLYNTCKAGLSNFTRSVIQETVGSGVAVVDFQPGDFRTAFNQATQRNPDLFAKYPHLEKAWGRLESNLEHSLLPEKAAAHLRKVLLKGHSGTVATGDVFQSIIAPLLARGAPERLLLWCLRVYFSMPKHRTARRA
ncbi:MAG: SDR family oxidoreductase [Verrucomicrobiota bacterium]|nr:SDR family oxidoreductase [Verrucomicrobiota bacterium]